MQLKLNTGIDPINAVFSDWQLKAIEALALTGQSPIGNKAIWDYVISSGLKISIASIINFVQALHEFDLLMAIQQTGKGGKRWAYTLKVDRQFFDSQVTLKLMMSLVQAYPDVNHFRLVRMALSEI